MNSNPDLFDLNQVCTYFSLSESSIRRKVRQAREGVGNFPLPLFGSGCRVLFKKSDIENWNGEEAEVIAYTPSLTLPPHPTALTKNQTQVRKALEQEFGIKLPPVTSNEVNS
jgi:predicted DNA-binding transcriptional regulator AlpA